MYLNEKFQENKKEFPVTIFQTRNTYATNAYNVALVKIVCQARLNRN